MKINKKILLIILAFVIAILFNNNISQATATATFTNKAGEDIQLIVSDYIYDNHFNVMITESINHYYFYYSEDSFQTHIESSSIYLKTDNRKPYYYSMLLKTEVNEGILDFTSINEESLGIIDEDGYSQNLSNNHQVVFSNFKIYDYYDNSEVFQEAPLLTGTLPPIMERVEMGVVMKEIMEILPIVIIILVSLIAFWKGYNLLLQIFHNS